MSKRTTVIGTLFKKSPLVATGLVVGVGVLAFFGLRKLFAPSVRPPQIRGGKGRGIPQGWSPYPLAARLKNDMTGINWRGLEPRSWIVLIELPTDDMVIAVYEAFNEQYFNEGEGTLTEWIRNEMGGANKQLALTRLTSLQLP